MLSYVNNSGSTSIIMRVKQKLGNWFTNAIDIDVCEGTSSSISINPLLRKLDGILQL